MTTTANRFMAFQETPTPVRRHHLPSSLKNSSSEKGDYVMVHHYLNLVDTHGDTRVRRHTPMSDLESLPAVMNLSDSVGGLVEVSPAKSATSETEIQVNTSFTDLITRMREDLVEDMKKLIDEKIDEKVNHRLNEIEHWQNLCGRAVAIRTVQDWAIQRMKKSLNIPQKSTISASQIIDSFIATFNVSGITCEELLSLKHSQEREAANEAIHVTIDDDTEVQDRVWRMLKGSVGEEELLRYEKYAKFGRGRYIISKK